MADMRLIVAGAGGRMGRTLVRVIDETPGAVLVGALANAGFPPFAGFFSKDEILAYVGSRGSWFVVLYVVGYVGAAATKSAIIGLVILFGAQAILQLLKNIVGYSD